MLSVSSFLSQFRTKTLLSPNWTKRLFGPAEDGWPEQCSRDGMKVAAKQNRKALDYFTSTIIPSQALQAVAVLTIKHAVLFVGFGVGIMALVRLLLAD